MTKNSSKRKAFTLAEMLIIVGVIGVIAMLVLPSFIKDMSERMNSNRQANIAQKVTKSVELMVANGEYAGITNTEEFVNVLSKYLKISKRCDKDHLEECWPSKEITTAKGETFEIKNAKTGNDLHLKSPSDNVGLVLLDGASIILNFNPNANPVSAEKNFTAVTKMLPVGEKKTKNFAYTSDATAAIDFVMDVNGNAGPNAENDLDGNYYDIRSFKKATFTTHSCADGVVFEKMCIVDLGMNYDPVDCTNSENAKYCAGSGSFVNYWAGGKKACMDIGMTLPTRDEALSLYHTGKSSTFVNENIGEYMSATQGIGAEYVTVGSARTNISTKRIVFCIGK